MGWVMTRCFGKGGLAALAVAEQSLEEIDKDVEWRVEEAVDESDRPGFLMSIRGERRRKTRSTRSQKADADAEVGENGLLVWVKFALDGSGALMKECLVACVRVE